MKTFKDFKRTLDEDAAGIGGGGAGPTNVTGTNIAGTGATDSQGKVTQQGMPPVNKKIKSDFPKNPIIEPLAKRANPNG